MASRWEDQQKVESLTKARKHGSDFLNVIGYDDLRKSFVNLLPEMGKLVSSLDCTAFIVVCEAGLVL